MDYELNNGFTTASELNDDRNDVGENRCITGYKRCPGPGGDRPTCPDCQRFAEVIDE